MVVNYYKTTKLWGGEIGFGYLHAKCSRLQ